MPYLAGFCPRNRIDGSFHLQVKCGVRGDTGPGCNAVGMIDRKIMGIQHLYRRPVYERTQECSINSPENGPLPPDAPSWCQAPFDPEGLLRFPFLHSSELDIYELPGFVPQSDITIVGIAVL